MLIGWENTRRLREVWKTGTDIAFPIEELSSFFQTPYDLIVMPYSPHDLTWTDDVLYSIKYLASVPIICNIYKEGLSASPPHFFKKIVFASSVDQYSTLMFSSLKVC